MTRPPPAARSRSACDVVAAADTPACTRLARTIRRWETEMLAYSTSDGLSGARSEVVNALIKNISRVGHGFRNLDNYRLQRLPHTGGVFRYDQAAATLPRRRPHSVA